MQFKKILKLAAQAFFLLRINVTENVKQNDILYFL